MNYNLPFALTALEVDFTLPLELFEDLILGFLLMILGFLDLEQ